MNGIIFTIYHIFATLELIEKWSGSSVGYLPAGRQGASADDTKEI
ncbi:MAG TPA: hypothetical protein VFN30_08615 [Chitinophagaceae bacterium]|nr:hypothetical protein [Chitinophagaceae bacterium]